MALKLPLSWAWTLGTGHLRRDRFLQLARVPIWFNPCRTEKETTVGAQLHHSFFPGGQIWSLTAQKSTLLMALQMSLLVRELLMAKNCGITMNGAFTNNGFFSFGGLE